MTNPYEQFAAPQSPAQAAPAGNDNPYAQFAPPEPKIPDTSGLQQSINANMAPKPGEEGTQEQQTPAQKLNTAMGYNALGPYKQGDALPENVRKHINDCYANGTASTAADCMQSTLPQVATSSALGTAARTFAINQPSNIAGIAGGVAGAQLVAPAAAAVGAVSGPYAPFTAGAVELAGVLGGATVGSAVVAKGVSALQSEFPDAFKAIGLGKEQMTEDEKQHPGVKFWSGLMSNLPYFTPQLATKAKMLLNGAIGAAQEGGREWSDNEKLDWAKILGSAGVMAVSNKETFAGSAIASRSAAVGDKFAAGYQALRPAVGAKLNIPEHEVTNDHIDTTIAEAHPAESHPHAADFDHAATVLFGEDGAARGADILREINTKTGVRPEQVYYDAQHNKSVADDLTAAMALDPHEPVKGTVVPSAYAHLMTPAAKAELPSDHPDSPYVKSTEEEPEKAAPVPKKPLTPEQATAKEAIAPEEEILANLRKKDKELEKITKKTDEDDLEHMAVKNNIKVQAKKVKDMYADAGIDRGNTQNLTRKPKGAIGFIKSMGGIKPSGETARYEGGKFSGVFNDKSGLSLEEMRGHLQEAGYIEPEDPNAPAKSDVNDVHNILERHESGITTYPHQLTSGGESEYDPSKDEYERYSAGDTTYLQDAVFDKATEMGAKDLTKREVAAMAQEHGTSDEPLEDIINKHLQERAENLASGGSGGKEPPYIDADGNPMPEGTQPQIPANLPIINNKDAVRRVGLLNKLIGLLPDKAADVVRAGINDIVKFAMPMSRIEGITPTSKQAQVGSELYARNIVANDWTTKHFDKYLLDNFTKEEREQLATAREESSLYAMNLERNFEAEAANKLAENTDLFGENAPTEEQIEKELQKTAAERRAIVKKKTEEDGVGMFGLKGKMREISDALTTWQESIWQAARKTKQGTGEGIPFYLPRVGVMKGEDGQWRIARRSGDGSGPIPLEAIGKKFSKSSDAFKHRSHETIEETEAALKELFKDAPEEGDQTEMDIGNENAETVHVAKDIRIMVKRLGEAGRAVAGKDLINTIKSIGESSGNKTVFDRSNEGTFTLAHPAFSNMKPEFVHNEETGKVEPAVDQNGDMIWTDRRLHIAREFEGPLRAVLHGDVPTVVRGLLDLKGRAVGLNMLSPFMHRMVISGRVFERFPMMLMSGQLHKDGFEVVSDPEQMQAAIKDGVYPVGNRYWNQDVHGIVEEPQIEPGKSWTSKLLGNLVGLVNKEAGQSVKEKVDAAGDYWHNKLLWDRVLALQMGLHKNIKDSMIADGFSDKEAGAAAAQMANRLAGSIPKNAIGQYARILANLKFFSVSYTGANLGMLKDSALGLTGANSAVLESQGGDVTRTSQYVKKQSRMVLLYSLAVGYISNEIFQNAVDAIFHDKSVSDEMKGYVTRIEKAGRDLKDNPLDPSNWNLPRKISALYETEKPDRPLLGYDKNGTGIHVRLPTGKLPEDTINLFENPLGWLTNKESPLAKGVNEIQNNQDNFGHHIYNPNAKGVSGWLSNAGKVIEHLVKTQSETPLALFTSGHDLVTGEGDRTVNAAKILGQLIGTPVSQGYPGGPAKGLQESVQREYQEALDSALPDIRGSLRKGDTAGAKEIMNSIKMNKADQNWWINHYKDPGAISPRAMKAFKDHASPEELEQMAKYQKNMSRHESPEEAPDEEQP